MKRPLFATLKPSLVEVAATAPLTRANLDDCLGLPGQSNAAVTGSRENIMTIASGNGRRADEVVKKRINARLSAVDSLVSDTSREQVIAMLIAVARAAHALADGTCDDSVLGAMTVDPGDFDDLSKALDALETLPEPGPNIYGTGPAKAEAFLSR
jgi:hypothetical protein